LNFLKKIQNSPEYIKKIIFWLVIIILAVVLFLFWLKITEQRIKSFQGTLRDVKGYQGVDNFQEIEYTKKSNNL